MKQNCLLVYSEELYNSATKSAINKINTILHHFESSFEYDNKKFRFKGTLRLAMDDYGHLGLTY